MTLPRAELAPQHEAENARLRGEVPDEAEAFVFDLNLPASAFAPDEVERTIDVIRTRLDAAPANGRSAWAILVIPDDPVDAEDEGATTRSEAPPDTRGGPAS